MLSLALATIARSGFTRRRQAAFTSAQCAGTDITGRGASFARDAHGGWRTPFRDFFCGRTAGRGHEALVTGAAQGSGAGRTAVKVREHPRSPVSG